MKVGAIFVNSLLFLFNALRYFCFLLLNRVTKNHISKQYSIPSRVFIIPQKFLGDVIITSQVFENIIKLNPEVKFVVLQYKSSVFEKIYKQRLGKNLEAIITYTNLTQSIKQIREA